MKKILVLLITIYQGIFSAILKNILGVNRFCRFSPTCSEYSKRTIIKNGIVKGSLLSFARLIRCQPFINL